MGDRYKCETPSRSKYGTSARAAANGNACVSCKRYVDVTTRFMRLSRSTRLPASRRAANHVVDLEAPRRFLDGHPRASAPARVLVRPGARHVHRLGLRDEIVE